MISVNDFGVNLKYLRKNVLGLTQEQMAEKLKVSPTQYKNYEQGRSQPAIDKLIEMCKILEIPADYLLRTKDKRYENFATAALFQELQNMDSDKSESIFFVLQKLYELKNQSSNDNKIIEPEE